LELKTSLYTGIYEEALEPVICPNMRALHLFDSKIWFYAVEDFLRCFPHLVTLSLVECYRLVDIDDVEIGTRCPALQELTLQDNGSFAGDKLLLNVSTHCPRLRVLHIPRSYNTTTVGIESVARHCPLLEDVDISRCKGVTNGVLILLAQNCHGLTRLVIRGCPVITDAGAVAVMQQCTQLEELYA
jgi:hypothetical protein